MIIRSSLFLTKLIISTIIITWHSSWRIHWDWRIWVWGLFPNSLHLSAEQPAIELGFISTQVSYFSYLFWCYIQPIRSSMNSKHTQKLLLIQYWTYMIEMEVCVVTRCWNRFTSLNSSCRNSSVGRSSPCLKGSLLLKRTHQAQNNSFQGHMFHLVFVVDIWLHNKYLIFY